MRRIFRNRDQFKMTSPRYALVMREKGFRIASGPRYDRNQTASLAVFLCRDVRYLKVLPRSTGAVA